MAYSTPEHVLHTYRTDPEFHAAIDGAVFEALRVAGVETDAYPHALNLALFARSYAILRPTMRGPVLLVFPPDAGHQEETHVRLEGPSGHIHVPNKQVLLSGIPHLPGNYPEPKTVRNIVTELERLQQWREGKRV